MGTEIHAAFIEPAIVGNMMDVYGSSHSHQGRHYFNPPPQSYTESEQVRQRTQEALERLDSSRRRTRSFTSLVDASMEGLPSTSRPRRYTTQFRDGIILDHHQQPSSRAAANPLRKSKSMRDVKSQTPASAYSVFPSPSRKLNRQSRTRLEEVEDIPPVPALPEGISASILRNEESFKSWQTPSRIEGRKKHKPSASLKIEPFPLLETSRPKTSASSESTTTLVEPENVSLPRNTSISDTSRPPSQWAPVPAKRTRSSTIRSDRSAQSQSQESLGVVDSMDKQSKGSNWELQTLFRRRNTLERKHQSAPVLRKQRRETHAPSTGVTTPSFTSVTVEDELPQASSFRSEFSDDSDSGDESDDENGGLSMIVRKMKQRLRTKKV